MLVSTAYAQAAAGAAQPGFDLMAFLPLVLIFIVFYIMLIRPQQKRLKDHKAMLDALRRGDQVVTGGGIVGTIKKVGADDEVEVEIAENVRIKVVKATITEVRTKPEPVRNETEAAPTESQPGANPATGIARFFGWKK